MRYRYRQPGNEDAFEEFCLRLLREHWSLPSLDRYGRRGERQNGVDLLDTSGGQPLRAVQCKHHDADMTLPPAEVLAEVEKARTFPDTIGEYYILTTAKKSTHTQRKVRAINKEHQGKKLFIVRLLTWDDIERIVDDCPGAQEVLGIQGPRVVRDIIRSELQPVHGLLRSQDEQIHGAELDEAKRRLDSKETPLASLLLSRIRTNSWDRLSARHRYRWCVIFAEVELRQGNTSRAAQLLIEAKSHQPDDVGATANEILALDLLGDRARAFGLARKALEAYPHASAIHAAAIRVAPSSEDFKRLVEAVPEHLRSESSVCVAIATRVDLETETHKSEERARRATEVAPNDMDAWFALGDTLVRMALVDVDPDSGSEGGLSSPTRTRLEEAHSCFDNAIRLADGLTTPAFQALTRVRRAAVRSFLGNTVEARADLDDAVRLAPADPFVLVAMAQKDGESGNHDAAIQRLRQVTMRQPDHEARCLLAMALWSRNSAGDRAEATQLAEKAALEGDAHVEAVAELSVEGFLEQTRYSDASELVERLEARIESCLLCTLKARIEAKQGRSDDAAVHALDAMEKSSDRTSRATLRRLARILASVGRMSDAVLVWEKLVVPGQANSDARAYVECLGRLGQHAKVLDFCASVRQAGILDEFLLQWELRFLDRYDPQEALQVLQKVVAQDPANKAARLHLVNLALRLQKAGLAEEHARSLPSVTDVDAETGAAVVGTLIALSRRSEAVDYAYDLLRRHFSEPPSHRAFMQAILHRAREDDVETPLEAGPGLAVSLKEDGTDAKWFVLEDSDVHAAAVENEIRADSTLARRITGKRVGDVVALSEGAGLGRTALIQEILPKHVFRFRDCGDRWQYRFPDHQELWVVRMRQSNEDGDPDFSPLIELAKDQHRRQRESEELYKRELVPIHLLGHALRKSEIHTVIHVASNVDLVLRCCTGTAEEYADAATALTRANEVILDATALTTLFLLEELDLPQALGKTLVVTPSTMACIRAFVEETRGLDGSAGSMGATEKGPVLFVPTPEDRRAALTAAEGFLARVERNCRMTGAAALAKIEPDDRKFLETSIGPSAAESLAYGAGASRVVWTDDYIAALVGREKLGARRIWTQGVLRILNSQGLVSSERYNRATARLLGWKYMFTSVNPEVMRTAGSLANWDPFRWPLTQAVEYLASDMVRTADAAQLAAKLVHHCYLDLLLSEGRVKVVQSVSESLAKRIESEPALLLFAALLNKVFGVNAAAQMDAKRTFEAWRREYVRRIGVVRR